MGRVCAVKTCKSGTEADNRRRNFLNLKKPAFFKVPKSPTRRQQWVDALSTELTDTKFVCELHFHGNVQSSWVTNLKNGVVDILPKGKTTRTRGSIPQIESPEYEVLSQTPQPSEWQVTEKQLCKDEMGEIDDRSEDSEKYPIWLDAVGHHLKYGEGKSIPKNMCICDLHFDKNNFEEDDITILKDGVKVSVARRKKRLKANSIPTIFRESHSELQTQELLESQPSMLTPKPSITEFEKEHNVVDNDNNRSQESHPDGLDENDCWNLQDNSDDGPEFWPSPGRENKLDFEPSSGLKKRSQVWNVFTEKPFSESIALCNVCNQEICYRSTSNNLKKHFQRKHPDLSMRDKIELLNPKEEPSEKKYRVPLREDSCDVEDGRDDEEEKFIKRKPSQIWKYFSENKHPHIEIMKTEVIEVKESTLEVPIKTCLICLQNDSDGDRDFSQIINCGPEEKSYMSKIQEIMNQTVVIDESHVLCQFCIEDLEKVIRFKEKIIKAFEFWSKVEPEPEPEQEAFEINTDNDIYPDLGDGENLAKKVKITQKRNKGDEDEEDKFYCEQCGRGFNMELNLTKHIEKCQNNMCNMCGRVFKKANLLRDHMTTHTGESNFCCNLCGKTFQRLTSGYRHMKSHNPKPEEKSKKKFLCTICGKSLSLSGGVAKHMRTHLVGEGEKRYGCTVCLKKFNEKAHLNAHMRIHSGERPFDCKICGRTYSFNSTLWKHMKSHVGSRKFARTVKNRGTTLETNVAPSLEVIETGISEVVEGTIDDDSIEIKLEANIAHEEVVTEDGVHVMMDHEINLDGS